MTTTDPSTIASALYGATPTPAAPAGALYPSAMTAAPTPAPTPSRPPGAGPERAPTPTDMEVTAAALYGDGGLPGDSPEAYDGAALSSAFDSVEFEARFEGDAEAVAFYAEARQQAAGLLMDLSIPMPVAKQLSVSLGQYISEPLSDNAIAAMNAATETELRAAWGSDYEKNVAQAKRVYKTCLARMPSLAACVEAGAGSDPKFIRALYNAGKRGRR